MVLEEIQKMEVKKNRMIMLLLFGYVKEKKKLKTKCVG